VFYLDKITTYIEYIFLQEGPIDAMFLPNSVALAGIHPTDNQLDRMNALFPTHNLVYVLDNQWVDKTSLKFTKSLLEKNESVFIWPQELINFKDLNDLCVHLKKDVIKPEFIIKHTYTGMKGLIQLSQCKPN
jgi:predicted ATPase